MKKRIYIENTPLNEALEKWKDRLLKSGVGKPLKGETINAVDSLGRVTAEAVFAKISSPFYHSSAMDGYAVRFIDTVGAHEASPKQLKIPDQAVYVATGDPIPEGFNTVIMIEDINIIKKLKPREKKDVKKMGSSEDKEILTSQPPNLSTSQSSDSSKEENIEIIKPATPWQHVRTIGEDIVTTELILPENHRIRPVDIGAILAGGITEINVRIKPKVVLIPTGSEIVEPGKPLNKGNIIESNSRIFEGLITEWGAEPVRFPIVPDNIKKLKKSVLEAVRAGDLVIINAGASAGKRDYTSTVIRELGEVLIHGLNIKPGKPAILGWVQDKPVLGIPGYPVSAYITFQLFAKPLIHMLQGIEAPEPETIRARLSRQVASTLGMEEFLRVKVGQVGEQIIASPVSRGAGVLMSLVRADGFIRIPPMIEGLAAGSEVTVNLLRDKHDIANTIVCIGSHDNTLDVLANFLKKRHPKLSLSSAHIGSLGGLIALKRGEAHIAGTHLLDEKTGEYNIPFIKQMLKDENIILINLVYRQQGFLVLKGNPKKIKGFKDLARDDIRFINRQAGSGTRLLTDKYLRELDINPQNISGYEREEFTHMGVASAVLSNIADTGLGIFAASQALGLDFIPVAKERYDLAIPEKFYKTEPMKKLLAIMTDKEFKETVEKLGGYDTTDTGMILYPK
jgi:putative molybdopterin biosynthesis protein